MICSHLVNLSLLLGAVLSWGVMWPLIRGLRGEWFPRNSPDTSMESLDGYKVRENLLISNGISQGNHVSILICGTASLQVFISISLILGDGLYNFLKVFFFTSRSIHNRVSNKNSKACK